MLFIKKEKSENVLSLDEAIAHARDVAEGRNPNVKACSQCAKEHAQLADWLEELKAYKQRAKSENDNNLSDVVSDAVEDIVFFGHITEPTERLIILAWKKMKR